MLHYLVILIKNRLMKCVVFIWAAHRTGMIEVSMAAAQMTDSGSIPYFWKDGSAI